MFHDGNNFPYSDVIIVCGASSSSQGRVMDIISLSPITERRVVRCPPAKYWNPPPPEWVKRGVSKVDIFNYFQFSKKKHFYHTREYLRGLITYNYQVTTSCPERGKLNLSVKALRVFGSHGREIVEYRPKNFFSLKRKRIIQTACSATVRSKDAFNVSNLSNYLYIINYIIYYISNFKWNISNIISKCVQ